MAKQPKDPSTPKPQRSAGQTALLEKQKIVRVKALQVFLELGPSRTVARAHAELLKTFASAKLNTMKTWVTTHGWMEEAAKYDAAHKADVVSRIEEILDIEKLEPGHALDFILKKMLAALSNGTIVVRDANDAQKIASAAERIAKIYELIKNPESARRKYIDGKVVHEHHHTHEVVGPTMAGSAKQAAALLDNAVRARAMAELPPPVPAQIVDAEVVEPEHAPIVSQEKLVEAQQEKLAMVQPAPAAVPSSSTSSMDIHSAAMEAGKRKMSIAELLAVRK